MAATTSASLFSILPSFYQPMADSSSSSLAALCPPSPSPPKTLSVALNNCLLHANSTSKRPTIVQMDQVSAELNKRNEPFKDTISEAPGSGKGTQCELIVKHVLIPIGFGIEEIEVVVMVDILRRAGADVLLASVEENLHVETSRRVKLVADTHISACEKKSFDLIALPGGMPGSARLQDCQLLKKMTIDQADNEKLVGAISMSPALALQEWGIMETRKATCHPGFVDKMSPTFMTNARVQTDGCVTTSQGPGTVFDFTLFFVEQLYGREKYEEVLKPLVLGSRSQQERSKSEYNPRVWKANAMPMVLVPIANGSEEMEAIIIIGVLRRANMRVVVASVEQDLQIEASRKVKIVADKHIEDVTNDTFDIIVLPGGMPGAERLRDCTALQIILEKHIKDKRPVGAVCAAPAVIMEASGLLKGKRATCHPAFSEKLSKRVVRSRVVLDGYYITSQGPGTAMEFSLCIVEKFFGKDRALNVAKGLVFQQP